MTVANVLIVGNSHTVAPRVALQDHAARWPDIRFDILSLPPVSMPRLIVYEGSLIPTTPKARQHMILHNRISDLPLGEYDAFVVLGGPALSSVAQLQAGARSFDFPSAQQEGTGTLISTAYMDAMIRTRIHNSAAVKLARMLSELQQGPVLLMDAVLPSAECRDDPEGLQHYVDMAARGDAADFRKRYLRILTGALAKHARLVSQPAQTIVEDAFTAPEWMRGSVMLGPKPGRLHEAREYRHANSAYGALQLDTIIQAFARL